MLYTGLALLFSFLWSTGFVAVEFGLRSSPPLFMMGFRFLVAGSLLLLLVKLRGARLPATGHDWGKLTILGSLNFAAFFGLTAIALQSISAGTGAILASTNPLMLALVAPFLLNERFLWLRGLGMAIAFSSVAWIMSSRMGVGESPWHMSLILLANAAMVAGTILIKRWKLPYDLPVMNGAQLLVGGVILLSFSFASESLTQVIWDTNFLLTLTYQCFVLSWATMMLYLFLLKQGDASKANAFLFLNPVFGLFLGAILLGELLQPADFLGTIGVAFGIYLVLRARS